MAPLIQLWRKRSADAAAYGKAPVETATANVDNKAAVAKKDAEENAAAALRTRDQQAAIESEQARGTAPGPAPRELSKPALGIKTFSASARSGGQSGGDAPQLESMDAKVGTLFREIGSFTLYITHLYLHQHTHRLANKYARITHTNIEP